MGACCSKDDANPQNDSEPSRRKGSLKLKYDMGENVAESKRRNTYEGTFLSTAEAQEDMDRFFELSPEEQRARKSTIV